MAESEAKLPPVWWLGIESDGSAKMLLSWFECAWLYECERLWAWYAAAYLDLPISSSRSDGATTGVADVVFKCVLITSGGGEDLTSGDLGIGANRGGGLGVGVLSQKVFGVEAACGTGAGAFKNDGTIASSFSLSLSL